MSRRAESLADRIEEGAAGLADFAEGLSEEEWRTPVTSGNDRRSVGVLVHHVASMYPIEIDVVRAVASGKSVMDVTWEAVAGINVGERLLDDPRALVDLSAFEAVHRTKDSPRGARRTP